MAIVDNAEVTMLPHDGGHTIDPRLLPRMAEPIQEGGDRWPMDRSS
ncbi:MAG: hypothetical protein ACRDQ4_08185 [Pseudonocardiaceae bacterium]